jgi:hypothetical protein
MQAGANLPAVGGFNQIVVLDAVRRAPDGISRVELAAQTGLSAQTIGNVSRRLLSAGLIVEAGTIIAGVGKPRTILRLEPRGRYAVGVHVDPTVVTVVLLDLAGGVVAHRTIPTPDSRRVASTLGRISDVVDEVLVTAGVDRERMLGVGIAAPGPVDLDSGTVIDPPLLEGWRHVPVRDELARRLGMPALLEKDVTAAAVAETWMGAATEHGNLVFFYYGTGAGVGLVVQNEVIRGVSSNAGDVGNLVVAGGRPGDTGCGSATPSFRGCSWPTRSTEASSRSAVIERRSPACASGSLRWRRRNAPVTPVLSRCSTASPTTSQRRSSRSSTCSMWSAWCSADRSSRPSPTHCSSASRRAWAWPRDSWRRTR